MWKLGCEPNFNWPFKDPWGHLNTFPQPVDEANHPYYQIRLPNVLILFTPSFSASGSWKKRKLRTLVLIGKCQIILQASQLLMLILAFSRYQHFYPCAIGHVREDIHHLPLDVDISVLLSRSKASAGKQFDTVFLESTMIKLPKRQSIQSINENMKGTSVCENHEMGTNYIHQTSEISVASTRSGVFQTFLFHHCLL